MPLSTCTTTQNKNARSKPVSKSLFLSSAATVLSAFAFTAIAPAAQAQVTVNTCAGLPVNNPGVSDAGETVNIDTSGDGECIVASGDIIHLEDGQQDDIIINIASGTLLTSTDADDEDTVIFIDNSENNTEINIANGAVLSGFDGVIFIEGDGTTINNSGDIIGTGAAEEGVIYIDRDTDSDVILINNNSTGRIIAQDNGPAIGIELLIADGADDAEDIGVQSNFSDFPTVTIINRNGGLIQTTGSASDDNDAINIAGNPGDTGGFTRACIETTDSTGAPVATPALNCIVNLRVVNGGTIQSIYDSSSNAGITVEDDALFMGVIANRVNGTITGTRNGIRIGDIVVGSETAEHDGRILNLGTISGTGASSRGIDIEGDGIRITNGGTGTISGVSVGIEVGAGTSSGIEHSGMNNAIVNRGTITGGNYSIDSNSAEGAIRVVNFGGGALNGDVRGSTANTDLLNFGSGTSTLTHDILQNFDVTVAPTGTLAFSGSRTIEGNLLSRGTLSFDIADTQIVTGNVQLTSGSTVEIADAGGVAAQDTQYTLIDVGGTLINNAGLDATPITDLSALLDFELVDSGDLVVRAFASGGMVASSDKVAGYLNDIQFKNASAAAFGGTVLTAFVDGGLDYTQTFSNLGGLETFSDVGIALNSLAPDYSGQLADNVFNAVQYNSALIDNRLSNLECNAFGQKTNAVALDANAPVESCLKLAETGSWFQSSRPDSSQGSLSLSTPTLFNNGFGQDSLILTAGYDQAVSDSTIIGFSGSYTESDIHENADFTSSVYLDAIQVSAYAGHRVGNLHLTTKASYSHGEANTRRQSFDVIRSEVDLDSANIQSVASYNVDLGKGYYLKPEAGFHYNNITTQAFTESGGLNLSIDETNTNVLDARVGMTFGARQILSEKSRADFFVTGAVRNDLFGERDEIGYAFADRTGSLALTNTDAFAVQGLAGVNFISGEKFSFSGTVNSEFSENETSVGGSVQTKIRW
jgi:hypothetical protein